ncbi:hypothetical protein AMTRI_Chr05g57250 [Amborella trichopoda]
MEVVKAIAKQATAEHDRAALRFDMKTHSYGQLISATWQMLQELEAATTKSFQSEGVVGGKWSLGGARVGILAKPSAEFVAGVLATWFGGGVVIPLAVNYPEAELFHVLNDSEVSVLLSTEEHREIMEIVASKCGAKYSQIPTVPSTPLANGVHEVYGDVEADILSAMFDLMKVSKTAEGNDPALIVYTSGTTSKPKGAVHTHNSIAAQVKVLTEAWECSSTDQFLHCLPLHHIHPMLLTIIHMSFNVDFLPKFSVRGIWHKLRESYPKDGNAVIGGTITVFTGVPTMYTRLLQGYEAMDPETQAASSYAARQLRLMMCGSAALPYPLMKQWESITGHWLLDRYGMTEFGVALSNPLKGVRKAGTVGLPLPGVQLVWKEASCITNTDNENLLSNYLKAKIIVDEDSDSSDGELAIKCASLFKEYWKQPKITKEAFMDDGFFRTGDTVTMDEDGYYIISGRTNADIMKVGGYKLSALDIEAVLLEHPDVAECSVLGLSDEDYGQVVCAVIVPEASARERAKQESRPAMTLEELQAWAKDKLAPYKIPTKLFVFDAFKRNHMGKVNKKDLKKELEQLEQ